jgi:hypothetical protein
MPRCATDARAAHSNAPIAALEPTEGVRRRRVVDARRRRVVARTNAERRTRERTNDERTNGDVSTKRRGER